MWGQWSLGGAQVLRGPHERPPLHLLWVSVGEVCISSTGPSLPQPLGELRFSSQPREQLCELGAGQRGGLRAPSSGLGAGPHGLRGGRLSSEQLLLFFPLIPFSLSSAVYLESTSEFKAKRNKSLSYRVYPCGLLLVLLRDRVGYE